MKRLMIYPLGWPCTLRDCRPGHFVHEDQLCFKSEYGCDGTGDIEAFNNAGEYFCMPADTIVQPVDYEWEEE